MSEAGAQVAAWARRHPIWAAVLLGTVARTVAALSGFGWFAADDYFYVVEPAWRWLEQPDLAYVSPIRSPLFPRLFTMLLTAGDALADDPRHVLRIAYLGLGLASLAVIPGAYLLARRLGSKAAATAAMLVAVYALMPRVATRALIEAAAMVPLVWSLALLERSDRGAPARRFSLGLAGGLSFAFSAMVRFQVGIIAPVLAGWLLWRALCSTKSATPWARWAAAVGFGVAGFAGALGQVGVDKWSGRPAFGTLVAYLDMNIERSSSFGESAWYTYLLHLVLLTVPPVTLWLARPLWRACRAHGLVSLSVAAFVLAHTLVPHKEDRFLFPILPLLLVLLGAALVEVRRGGLWARRAFVLFWGLNGAALVVACFSDAQRNMTEPLLAVREAGAQHELAVVGAGRVPLYYLGRDSGVVAFRRLDDFLDAVTTEHLSPEFVLVRPMPSAAALERIAAAGLRCTSPRLFEGDLVDRAIVALNPRRNKRRRPTGLLDCRDDAAVNR